MSAQTFHGWPPWVMALGLAGYFAGGIALGGVHFGGLWWTARLFAEGDRMMVAVGIMIGRIVVLGGLLTLVSFAGAPPLLAAAAGVLLARSVVTRRVRPRAE